MAVPSSDVTLWWWIAQGQKSQNTLCTQEPGSNLGTHREFRKWLWNNGLSCWYFHSIANGWRNLLSPSSHALCCFVQLKISNIKSACDMSCGLLRIEVTLGAFVKWTSWLLNLVHFTVWTPVISIYLECEQNLGSEQRHGSSCQSTGGEGNGTEGKD